MKRSVYTIAAITTLAAGLAWAGATITVSDRSEVGIVQQALDHLSGGRNYRAELVARDLLRGETPSGRAWIIVAESLNRRREYDRAIEAYKEFLVTCDSPATRGYVMEQLQRCESADRSDTAAAVPSESLSATQLEALARADDRLFSHSTAHFEIQARNPDLAALVGDQAEKALMRICGVILPQDYPHHVKIFVWSDRDDFRANSPETAEWAGGSFTLTRTNGQIDRRIDLTQLDENKRFDPAMLDRVLPHEMCHLVLAEFFGDAPCPLFLNEGLAMLSEWQIDNDRLELAAAALAGKQRIGLETLLVTTRRDLAHEGVFYAESLSLVEYIHSRLTRKQFAGFLDAVKDGCTVGDALERALYAPPTPDFLDALSAAWEKQAIRHGQDLQLLEKQQLTDAHR